MKERPIASARSAVRHPAVEEALRLYEATSGIPMREVWEYASPEKERYLRLIYQGPDQKLTIKKTVESGLWHQNGIPDDQFKIGYVWTAFTAGKDSLAVAIRLRSAGMRPILYHLAGINRAWPDEVSWAMNAAKALKMPLVVDEFVVRGRKTGGMIGCPVRNQVVALFMAARAEAHGTINSFAFGTVSSDDSTTQNPLMDWTDGREVMEAFDDYLSTRMQLYQRYQVLRNEIQSIATVAGAGMLDYSHSCMSPLRFRGMRTKQAEAKFGKQLPGRCGTCFKCCAEVAILEDLGVRPAAPGQREYADQRVREFLDSTGRVGQSYVEKDSKPGIEELKRDPEDWPTTPIDYYGRYTIPPIRSGYTVGSVDIV